MSIMSRQRWQNYNSPPNMAVGTLRMSRRVQTNDQRAHRIRAAITELAYARESWPRELYGAQEIEAATRLLHYTLRCLDNNGR